MNVAPETGKHVHEEKCQELRGKRRGFESALVRDFPSG